MALGALFAWIWIPKLQDGPDLREKRPMKLHHGSDGKKERRPQIATLPSKDLERLAKGWSYATNDDTSLDRSTGKPRGENQQLGFRKKIGMLYGRIFHGGVPTSRSLVKNGKQRETTVVFARAEMSPATGVVPPQQTQWTNTLQSPQMYPPLREDIEEKHRYA
jgi:hypothetical protein